MTFMGSHTAIYYACSAQTIVSDRFTPIHTHDQNDQRPLGTRLHAFLTQ